MQCSVLKKSKVPGITVQWQSIGALQNFAHLHVAAVCSEQVTWPHALLAFWRAISARVG